MSLAFESIAPCNRFEFDPDSILDGNHGSCLELKSRPCRAYLVNGQRIVAVHQHMPAPLAHSHDEQLDLEIGGRLPLRENLQYPLLGILVLRRRSLRTFEPADHVLHRHPPLSELKSPERLILEQQLARLGFVEKSAHDTSRLSPHILPDSAAEGKPDGPIVGRNRRE